MRHPLRNLIAVCLLLLVALPPRSTAPEPARPILDVGAARRVAYTQEVRAQARADAAFLAAYVPPQPQQEGTTGAQAKQERAYYTGNPGVWDRIAACESSGNWADNTGNGYYGGLQMDMNFWDSYGGNEFAVRPDLASREQQIIVAERARDSGRGYRPWPVCGQYA